MQRSVGFVVAHNFICSQMKTAFKQASRNSWRQHRVASSDPTSTSVSQIRPERDFAPRQVRRKRISKGEDYLSRIKSEVTTSASSAFRWRIENWRRRTNLSSTDQSRQTRSTSIGTDSRRYGSSSAQRDGRDTLSVPIEENDLDLELTRSLSKSASRSGQRVYTLGSVGGTERSSRTGNIVLEHMRLEPITQVSLVGNQTLREEQHKGSVDCRGTRKMSSAGRSCMRPSIHDGTVESWSQAGRSHLSNINCRKESFIDTISERNPSVNGQTSISHKGRSRRTRRPESHQHGVLPEQKVSRYQKSRTNRHHLSSDSGQGFEESSKHHHHGDNDPRDLTRSRDQHVLSGSRGGRTFEQMDPTDTQKSSEIHHQHESTRHLDPDHLATRASRPTHQSSTMHGDQESTENLHQEHPTSRETERTGATLAEKPRDSSHGSHIHGPDYQESEHGFRERSSMAVERRGRRKSRKRKRKLNQSHGKEKT